MTTADEKDSKKTSNYGDDNGNIGDNSGRGSCGGGDSDIDGNCDNDDDDDDSNMNWIDIRLEIFNYM